MSALKSENELVYWRLHGYIHGISVAAEQTNLQKHSEVSTVLREVLRKTHL